MTTKRKHQRRLATKRAFDTAAIVAASPVVLPVAALTALAVRVKMGSPVLFTQKRIGLNEKPFTLLKFRSMLPETDKGGNPIPNEQRLTSFGRVLRKSSLDEIPQLLNVLRGDMSLVGPRPLLPEYLPFYTEDERERHTVRPGITGLAQVSGRNALGWDARLAKDSEYGKFGTLVDDAKILAKTVKQLVSREGTQSNPWESGEYLNVYRGYPRDEELILRRFEPHDIPTRVAWFNDPATSRTMRLGGPVTEAKTMEWLKRARANKLRRDYCVVDRITGEIAALIGHKRENPDSMPVVYIAVAPDRHGMGLGSRALSLLTLQMKENERLPGAIAEIFTDNLASQRIFEKSGYQLDPNNDPSEDRLVMAAAW